MLSPPLSCCNLLSRISKGFCCKIVLNYPQGIITFNINNVLNKKKNKPKEPVATVPPPPKKKVLSPYIGLHSNHITERIKSCVNRFSLLYIFMSKLFFKTPPDASNSSSDTRTVSTDHNYPKSFIKQIAGTAITFTLEKRNEDFMTGKQNILRPFRNVITLLLLLITFKQMVTTSNGTILTFCRPVKLTTIVKLKRPCLFRSCS